jgi:hypothetical protein
MATSNQTNPENRRAVVDMTSISAVGIAFDARDNAGAIHNE